MNFEDKTVGEIEAILISGQCYPAAIAMSEILDWPVGGLLVDARRVGWRPHLVHAYVLCSDGRAFDASGFRSLDDVYSDYLGNRPASDFRDPQFVTYGSAADFRKALRRLYEGGDVADGARTEYDDYLDEHVPGIKEALVQRIDIESRARVGFPNGDEGEWQETAEEWKDRIRRDVEERFGPTPTDLVPAGPAGW